MSLADTTETEPQAVAASAAARRVLGIPFTFFSFLIVGAIAFVVNEVALFLVYDSPLFWFLPDKDVDAGFAGVEHPDIRLFVASVLSVEAAIAWKFFAYEHWTFADRPRRGNIVWRFVQLNAASLLGTIVTIGTVNLLTPILGISPYVSTSIGIPLGDVAETHLRRLWALPWGLSAVRCHAKRRPVCARARSGGC